MYYILIRLFSKEQGGWGKGSVAKKNKIRFFLNMCTFLLLIRLFSEMSFVDKDKMAIWGWVSIKVLIVLFRFKYSAASKKRCFT